MLPATPYKITLDELSFEVNHLHIALVRFIPSITTFKDNTYPYTLAAGKYTDKEFYRSADISLGILILSTIPTDALLRFIGKFSVEGPTALNAPGTCVILTKYALELMNDYVKDKPVVDRHGNLFEIPHFDYIDEYFKDTIFT